MRYLTLLSDGDAKTWTRHNEVVRELATKEKLGGESDGALTQLLKLLSCRNITEEPLSIHII